MSSKMQFQVFYGDYNVLYGPNGVYLSAFKCTFNAIDKPLERSFGSICKWLQRGFRIDLLTKEMEEYEGSSNDEQYSLPKERKEYGFGSHVAEDVRNQEWEYRGNEIV